MHVLLVERSPDFRRLLRYLLERRGARVTERSPETLDIRHEPMGYDVVLFDPTQRAIRRERWLFGVKPDPKRTRLVALCPPGVDLSLAPREIDAAVRLPVSASVLWEAITGGGAEARRQARALPAWLQSSVPLPAAALPSRISF